MRAPTIILPALPSGLTFRAGPELLAFGLAGGVVVGAQAAAFSPWLAAALGSFVLLAVHWDLGEHRIPNLLTLSFLALSVAAAGWTNGLDGIGRSLLGAATGFALLIVPYSFRAVGGGDVKAVTALGAALGAGAVLSIVIWSMIFGGVIGMLAVLSSAGAGELVRSWCHTLQLSLFARRWLYVPPRSGARRPTGIPFAVAIGLGLITYLLIEGGS